MRKEVELTSELSPALVAYDKPCQTIQVDNIWLTERSTEYKYITQNFKK